METSCLSQCMNELLQLYKTDVEPRVQLATAQAVYLALDKSSDIVHITDQNLSIQVTVNKIFNSGVLVSSRYYYYYYYYYCINGVVFAVQCTATILGSFVLSRI